MFTPALKKREITKDSDGSVYREGGILQDIRGYLTSARAVIRSRSPKALQYIADDIFQ